MWSALGWCVLTTTPRLLAHRRNDNRAHQGFGRDSASMILGSRLAPLALVGGCTSCSPTSQGRCIVSLR